MVKHEYGGYDLYLPRVQKANSLKGRKNQICEWSEWTDFNNCTEISYQADMGFFTARKIVLLNMV